MTEERGTKDEAFQALDVWAGLYHEAQADGVPYAEEPEPVSPSPDATRS